MGNKIFIVLVSLMGLTGCGSIPTTTIQTSHFNFTIPSYRQSTEKDQRQDVRSDTTGGSILIEYSNITKNNYFPDFVQANIDTLRQNLGTQLQDEITATQMSINCSGNTLTGEMISFAVLQNEDVLYLSQIFAIHNTDITAISIASPSSNIRSETANTINDTIECRL